MLLRPAAKGTIASMKKLISVFLCISLLVSVTGICAVAAQPDEGISFALASDLHYNVPRDAIEGEIDDPIFWYSNRRAAMNDESGFIIDEFLRQCAQDEECEFVLISGDLADHGRTIPQEHYDMAEKLRAFEESSGKQVYVINGNHDASEDSQTTFADFMRIYADFGYDKALATDEGTCSYTANLGTKYRLIALDSCGKTASTEDGMSQEKLDWVHEQADAAKRDGRYPILMMHHNLLDHMPLERIISRNFIVRFHYTTAELFADWGIKLVFTGHEHCSDATSFTSALGNVIYDFATTALTMYPLEYRMFSITENEIEYTAKSIDSIDTDALTARVSGYSPEQISLMNSDMRAYSKGFLKKGIEYRLSLSLSMEKLGIAEDAIYYNLVKTAVEGITDILSMPLYGDNSVQQIAEQYGTQLPDSDFETGWDLVTDVVAAHYAGEEAYDLDGPEVTLLLKTLVLILKTDLAAVSDELFLGVARDMLEQLGADVISDELTELGNSVYGSVEAGQYFILALVSPLLYGFAYDDDGVNDNNGILPGYGSVSAGENLANIGANVTGIAARITHFVQMIMKYVNMLANLKEAF